MIDGDIEEALNLLSVKIDRQYTGRTRGDQQIGYQLRCNRHTWLILTILTGIAVKRNHCGDATSRRTAGRVNHDEELHQILIGGITCGLDNKNIRATNVLINLNEAFPVRETHYRRIAERHIQIIANIFR